MRQFSNRQKAEILDECKKVGNVSKVAQKFDITRATIYNWQKSEDKIREALGQDTALRAIKDSFSVRGRGC
jgi:Transposase.